MDKLAAGGWLAAPDGDTHASMSDLVLPQTVLLRHTVPDGSSHVDWMIDLAGDERQPLVTFRLAARLDDLDPGMSAEATRIADHRRHYLDYEGPLSGGRGEVRRLASGRVEAMQNIGDVWGLLIAWRAESSRCRRQRLVLRGEGTACWRITVLPLV